MIYQLQIHKTYALLKTLKMQRQDTYQEKLFAEYLPNKYLYTEYIKKFSKQFKKFKQMKDLDTYFAKDDIKMVNNHRKKC